MPRKWDQYQHVEMIVRCDPGAKQAAVARGLTRGLKDAAETWRKRYLPRHFEESAYSRYLYHRRSKQYEIAKYKRFGHRIPLVWEGKARDAILSTMPAVSVRKLKLNAVWRGMPRYLFVKRKGGVRPAEEITTTIADERNILLRHVGKTARQYASKATGQKKATTLNI